MDRDTDSVVAGLDSQAFYAKARGQRRRDWGCKLNCKEMCCNKEVISQDKLLQIYL